MEAGSMAAAVPKLSDKRRAPKCSSAWAVWMSCLVMPSGSSRVPHGKNQQRNKAFYYDSLTTAALQSAAQARAHEPCNRIIRTVSCAFPSKSHESCNHTTLSRAPQDLNNCPTCGWNLLARSLSGETADGSPATNSRLSSRRSSGRLAFETLASSYFLETLAVSGKIPKAISAEDLKGLGKEQEQLSRSTADQVDGNSTQSSAMVRPLQQLISTLIAFLVALSSCDRCWHVCSRKLTLAQNSTYK